MPRPMPRVTLLPTLVLWVGLSLPAAGQETVARWEPIPVSGRVDAEGAPRAGLAVRLERAPLAGSPTPEPVATTTDESGLFRARVPEPGYWRVRLVPHPGDEPVTVTLPFQPVVEPVDWGDLAAELQNGQPMAHHPAVRTGPDGSFTLSLASGPRGHHLAAEHPARPPARHALAPLEPGERRSGLRVVVPGGVDAVGAVVGPHGRPVPGATVRLYHRWDGEQPMPLPTAPTEITTDRQGRFVARTLPQGTYDLTVVASGYPEARPRGLEIVAPAPERATIDLGTFTLERAARIVGQVTDPDGQPLEGLTVIWFQHRGQPTRFEAFNEGWHEESRTDRDGRFEIVDLLAGAPVLLFVHSDGFLRTPTEIVPTRPGDDDPVASDEDPLLLVLVPATSVVGRVETPDGEPVPDAWVRAEQMMVVAWPGRPGLGDSTGTDDDGRFVLSRVPPGRVELVARAAGWAEARRTVTVEAGDDPQLVVLTVEQGGTLTGRIADASGQPLGGAAVSLRPVDALPALVVMPDAASLVERTGDDGTYDLRGLVAGEYRVRVTHEEYAPHEERVTISSDAHRLDIQLTDRGWSIAGRVVAATGQPVAGARIFVSPTGCPWAPRGKHRTGADGSFVLRGLRADSVILSAQKDDLGIRQRVDLTAGSVDGLELTLAGHGRIRGRLVGLDAGRLAEAEVVIRGASLRQLDVSANGTFVADGLSPGDWWVSASAPGGRRVEETVVLEPGDPEATLELDLAPGELTLGGLVLVEGESAGGLRVLLARDGAPGAGGETDFSGRFRIPGIDPGRYELSVLAPTGYLDQRQIDLTASRDLVLEIETATVSGSVVDPATGSGIAGVEVRLIRAQGLVALAQDPSRTLTGPGYRTDELGRFEIGPVAAQRHLLVVGRQDPATAPMVDLSNGLDVVGLVVSPPGR